MFICALCLKFAFCRELILRTFCVRWYVQTIVNLQTIVDHCPQNFKNHWKTIETNGWALQKHSMVMVQRYQNHWKTIEVNGGLKKNINHFIALKNWPSLWSSRVQHCLAASLRGWQINVLQKFFRTQIISPSSEDDIADHNQVLKSI